MNGFLESLSNEEPGYTVTIACPGYIKTEIGEKKIVGDGTMQDVKLSVDDSKWMTAEKAAELVIYAIDKKKLKYHLTNQGEIGTLIKSFFPGFINNQVKSEMKKISE
jgi:dehydrogenase/reductase SDR family member 7B